MSTLTAITLAGDVQQLQKSRVGRNAIKALSAWLDNDGCLLDTANQEAVYRLLAGAWGGLAGSVTDALRDAVNP